MVEKDLSNLTPGLVSVGLPVYNGADYLREALDSLLAQDYPDFELIISDNCSTDETGEIAREYAARDPRVRYSRTDRNIGPILNWTRVYRLARGEFFMWAAHDDLRAPRSLSLCIEALRENPRAVMCCPDVRFIDERGHDITDSFPFECIHPTGATAFERMRKVARSTAWVDVYALVRTPALASTRLGQITVWGGDVVLISELSMLGEVVEAPGALFEYRIFQEKTVEGVADSLNTLGRKVGVSWIGFAEEVLESVKLAPLGAWEKLKISGMFAFESCLRNPSLRWGIRHDGFLGLGGALRRGEYRRALRLAALGSMSQTYGLYERVRSSASYRGRRIKRALLARESVPSGRE